MGVRWCIRPQYSGALTTARGFCSRQAVTCSWLAQGLDEQQQEGEKMIYLARIASREILFAE